MIWIPFKYERLPTFFCYNCGKVGHALKDCDVRESDEKEKESARVLKQYGDWLRASPYKNAANSLTNFGSKKDRVRQPIFKDYTKDDGVDLSEMELKEKHTAEAWI